MRLCRGRSVADLNAADLATSTTRRGPGGSAGEARSLAPVRKSHASAKLARRRRAHARSQHSPEPRRHPWTRPRSASPPAWRIPRRSPFAFLRPSAPQRPGANPHVPDEGGRAARHRGRRHRGRLRGAARHARRPLERYDAAGGRYTPARSEEVPRLGSPGGGSQGGMRSGGAGGGVRGGRRRRGGAGPAGGADAPRGSMRRTSPAARRIVHLSGSRSARRSSPPGQQPVLPHRARLAAGQAPRLRRPALGDQRHGDVLEHQQVALDALAARRRAGTAAPRRRR